MTTQTSIVPEHDTHALVDPPRFEALVAELGARLECAGVHAIDDADVEALFRFLGTLSERGLLRPALSLLARAEPGGGREVKPDVRARLAMQLGDVIEGELLARGVSGDGSGRFPSWRALSDDVLASVRATSVSPRAAGAPSRLLDAGFVGELEALMGARFVGGNVITPLVDGPASFALRAARIADARRHIYLLTWAIYDDVAGDTLVAQLTAAHARGVDVRVVVDGATARHKGVRVLEALERAGVAVIRFRDPARPLDGNHRKMLVVDDVLVAGGMNVGDAYAHTGAGPKWRDTDLGLVGPAVDAALRLFAEVWRAQCERQGLTFTPAWPPPAPAYAALAGSVDPSGLVAVVNDAPGPRGDAHIYAATLKAIEGATRYVDVQNAYVINTPALVDVLGAAVARGVRVRVMTNSTESVDEPIVSAPIQRSVRALVALGVEAYLKRGDTLHAKTLVVDDVLAMVTSYNLHPRSERYEEEMALVCLDGATSRALHAQFDVDADAARRVTSPDDVVVPEGALAVLVERLFFDHL